MEILADLEHNGQAVATRICSSSNIIVAGDGNRGPKRVFLSGLSVEDCGRGGQRFRRQARWARVTACTGVRQNAAQKSSERQPSGLDHLACSFPRARFGYSALSISRSGAGALG